MKNVVSTETGVSVTSMTSKDFLLSNPSSASTTARTYGGGRRIFEWEAHVERTASSPESMMEADGVGGEKTPSSSSPPVDRSVLRRRLDGQGPPVDG